MKKIRNVPYILYMTAMGIIFTSIFIFNVIGYEVKDRDITILFLIAECIITIGLIISLLIKVKFKEDKNKRIFNIIFLIGFIYIIFQSIADLIPSLMKIVEIVGVIIGILFYLLIIIGICLLIYSRFIKRNKKQ